MKNKSLLIIVILATVKFVIHAIANGNFGYHRDELLHLSTSDHLAWGYFEFPPFIAFLGKISSLFFDHSLWGTRLFSTLAGIAILVLCCLIAKELGGKRNAILLSGVCVLVFIPFYRNHTLFQPVAFNQFFWTLGFYFLVRFINSKHKKQLFYIGLVVGLGLLNKYTMLIWAFGAFIGLFFLEKGSVYKQKWIYLAGLLALLLFLPNVIWQFQNDLPFFQHLESLKSKQLEEISKVDFLLAQLELPFTLIISLFGLFFLLKSKYKAVGITVLVIFITMFLTNSKAYYVFGIYPVLFATGAVKIESLLQHKKYAVSIISSILLLISVPFIPDATPILPIEKYVAYAEKDEKNGRIELTGDYADMFGWEEQVQLVDSIYKALPTKEQQNCVIWAENYGEAGALQIIGEKYNLPKPISRHGSFWSWGYQNKNADVWISIGNEKTFVESVFEETQLVKMITHKYAIDEEVNIPLYICKKPKVDIEQLWKDYRAHVFD